MFLAQLRNDLQYLYAPDVSMVMTYDILKFLMTSLYKHNGKKMIKYETSWSYQYP